MKRQLLQGGLGQLLSIPRRRVRWKIMVPYAVLTLFFAAIGSFLVTRLVTESLEERFTNQLVESSRVASDAVVRRERQHLGVLRNITFTEGFPEAVSSGDAVRVARIAEPIIVNARAERVEVLDETGRLVFGTRLTDVKSATYASVPGPASYASWSIVADVLAGKRDSAGDKWAQLAWTDEGPALYTAGPVVVDGRVVGVVLVGSPLASFLPVAKGEALADITVYDPAGRLLATTFPLDESEQGQVAAPAEVGDRASASGLRESKTLFGRDYAVLYGDLKLRNEIVGRYGVALPAGYIASAGNTAQWQMALLFGAVTLGVIVLGWVVARQLTGPLLALVRTARRVAGGDLTARSEVHSGDEIGVLATTFDVMTEKLQRQHLQTIGALASAIDARDPYTAGHSLRVGNLSYELGREMGMPSARLQHLQVGGFLHDIGKIGVRDSVLLKQGELTAEERALIEQHPEIGLRILAPADLPSEVLAIVGGHHERLDGSGYPLGLGKDDLTIFPRIAAVADIYDALTTHRPYRAGMTMEEALRMLRREAMQGLLDPEVVSTMQKIAKYWEDVRRSGQGAPVARTKGQVKGRSA